MFKKFILFVMLIFGMVSSPKIEASPSVTGNTGLLFTPTAEFVNDGEMVVGVSYLSAQYAILRKPTFGDKIFYLSLGYLPYMEITLAVIRSDHIGNRWGIGDRVGLFRFKLLSEQRRFPAVVLGLHEPMGLVDEDHHHHLLNATYLAASKSFTLSRLKMALHLGYGVDWIGAAQHYFVGLFGGVSLSPKPFITFMIEYDSEKVNCGMRLSILNHLDLLAGLLHFDTFSGGVSYKFEL